MTTVDKTFEFCNSRVEKISSYLLRKESLSTCRQQLEERFSKVKTVPGTLGGFHCVVPLSENEVSTKKISADVDVFSEEQNLSEQLSSAQICTNTCVACVYDNHWFFGLVIDEEECHITKKKLCILSAQLNHFTGPIFKKMFVLSHYKIF